MSNPEAIVANVTIENPEVCDEEGADEIMEMNVIPQITTKVGLL